MKLALASFQQNNNLAGLGASLPTNLVDLLLSRGADPNIPDDLGLTALHAMVLSHDTPAVALLLSHGANPEAKSKAGQTSLQVAAMLGFADTVGVLLKGGADPRAVDDITGNNALAWCQEGAKRNRPDQTSNFPLTLRVLQEASR
jgi:ankyrin repeat protein